MEKLFIIKNTQNERWGLWGTAYGTFGEETAEKLWNATSILVHEIGDFDSNQTQELLDSHWGKYLVGEFCNEIENGTFIDAFRKKKTKEILRSDYDYYMGQSKNKTLPEDTKTDKYEKFCTELEKLSRKYGIVIQAVGGVRTLTDDFEGYNPDLDSGDLMPIWSED